MNHKELADYIEADIETRYKIHKAAYFEKHPNATLDKFHSFTVTHLIDQTEKLKNVNRATGKTNEEIDLYNAEIEVLDYIQNLKGEPLNDIYLINSNFWEQEKTKLEYKGFQREIEKHGFFNVKAGIETVKFYNPYLTVVLTSIELPVKNSVTHEETIINSYEFLMTYIRGYERGEQYFETEHKVSRDIFYGTGFKEYANDLHRFYFHELHGSKKGWVYVKNAEPHILTHKEIEEIGFYSGLVNKVEELIKKYPEKFVMFEKQGHGLQPKQAETPKLKVKQIALIHVYESIQVTRINAKEIAAKHGYTSKNSGEGLFQDYTNYCTTANRKAKPTPCTPKRLKNKIEQFESVVNYLSDTNKQRAIDEINILKTIFENEYQ